ncbi:MAG: BrnT family toxin [Acidobacteria bacterium]|nr:BrnT family toxin [Acidobacteriota bacterium]
MSYEWDARKAEAILRKHGVDFADAVTALEDQLAVTIRDLHPEEENRFITVGMDGLGRLLVVVYTWRGDAIRVISARKATRRERQQYEAGQ